MSTTDLDLGPVRIVPKGAYSATATYELLNMVSYEGSSWLMKASSYVVGTTPEEGDTWTLLAQRGETGAAGTNGQDGADGSDATVPIATTSVAGKVMASTLVPVNSSTGAMSVALGSYGSTVTGSTVVANTSVSCPTLILNGWTVTVSS